VSYSYQPREQPAHTHRRRAIRGHILLDERAERRLRRARWRRISIVLALLAVLGGAVALYLSPLLRVQEIQVVGTTNLEAERVVQLADLTGQSMFRLKPDEAEARLEALPLVKSAQVARRWPQTVRVQITERAPWGLWRIGDSVYVIDAEGVILPDVQSPPNAPVINDLGGPVKLQPGDRVDVDAVALARSMLERVPQTLALGIASLEYTPAVGLSFTTDAGYRVILGDSQNAEYKLAVWQAVENELGREAMAGHVLDLRFEDRPSFQ